MPRRRWAAVLAAMFALYSAPYGSDLNPIRFDSRIRMPTVPEYGVVYATLENARAHDDHQVALAASVTRDGLVSGLEVLGTVEDRREALDLLQGLTRARLEPAQFGGARIAGIDRHGRVAEHRFGARGCDGDELVGRTRGGAWIA